ncbi:MAG: hydroxymethylglutaryl-CoA lyase [Bacillota bacterium]|uniref:hydroxymethylglutaryl-CoA lyase n=1 Tax=Desulfurispora thermophila TaxID=265470 RepID=UPI000366D425|nr:hydroxymethylglutaryl-CoA lyase [Desulfurispora thermophila]
MHWPDSIRLREVGPRDGWQSIKQVIPTADKAYFILQLIKCGLRELEITSFVSPRAVPQHVDAEHLFDILKNNTFQGPEPVLSALVINTTGVKRAISCGVSTLAAVISATQSHSLANSGLTIEDALLELTSMHNLATSHGIKVRVAIATAFGYPGHESVDIQRLRVIVDNLIHLKIDEIILADTPGLASPRQIYQTVHALNKSYPGHTWGLHLHDAHGLGLTNVLAGIMAGATVIETSLGGLGGCPFLPGAKGNVATEKVAFMLQEMSINTGVSLSCLRKLLEKCPLPYNPYRKEQNQNDSAGQFQS